MSGVLLEPELGVWCKLIEMVSGAAAVIRRTSQSSLRPLFEAEPERGEVELPELSDWLTSRDHNRALLRFLALQLAGRRVFGSYDAQVLPQLVAASAQVQALFLVAEGVRVQHRVGLVYPGTLEDTSALASALLDAWQLQAPDDFARVCDLLLAAALAPQHPAAPHWLPEQLLRKLHALRAEQATVASSLLVARELAGLLEQAGCASLLLTAAPASCFCPGEPSWPRTPTAHADLAAGSAPPPAAAHVLAADRTATQLSAAGAADRTATQPSAAGAAERSSTPPPAANASSENSTPASRAARCRLPPTAASARRAEASASDFFNAHTSATALQTALSLARGFGPSELQVPAREPEPEPEPEPANKLPPVPLRPAQPGAQTFLYDEWDHLLGAYRAKHCRVQELPVVPDAGVFFERALHDARGLLGQVRRQFEQLRPERYRPLHGLEDGEDFDLNALTDARIEARAGRTQSSRIYTSRVRQARDVATLFLLDMSASTEQSHSEPDSRRPQRIIDTLKQALIVMTAALEKLGDQYAIYGFSSRGHDRVEVYPIKSFSERLDHGVKARIGGIEPKSGTRMGAALRHMVRKFSGVSARSKHLMLLSDGYPQDHDYGADRRTHTYGIEDTAVALRELSAAGPLPFCITVDRAGNDYLRLMCDPSQYLVIDDVAELPRELPKIYRRVARE